MCQTASTYTTSKQRKKTNMAKPMITAQAEMANLPKKHMERIEDDGDTMTIKQMDQSKGPRTKNKRFGLSYGTNSIKQGYKRNHDGGISTQAGLPSGG